MEPETIDSGTAKERAKQALEAWKDGESVTLAGEGSIHSHHDYLNLVDRGDYVVLLGPTGSEYRFTDDTLVFHGK